MSTVASVCISKRGTATLGWVEEHARQAKTYFGYEKLCQEESVIFGKEKKFFSGHGELILPKILGREEVGLISEMQEPKSFYSISIVNQPI